MLRKGPCMLTLVLCALAHGSKTLAADAATPALPAKSAGSGFIASTPLFDTKPAVPKTFLDSPVFSARLTQDDFSPTEFRPRRPNSIRR
jgi:hypothetical protein